MMALFIENCQNSKNTFDISEDSVFWCTADFAWVTGTIYGIFAPLINGVTLLLKKPTLRMEDFAQTLQKHNIDRIYTSPSLIALLNKQILDRSCVINAKIYTVGEKLNGYLVEEFYEKTGVHLRDTWFQSETGGIMLMNTSDDFSKAGSMGVERDAELFLIDNNEMPVKDYSVGRLVISRTHKSLFTDYYNQISKFDDKMSNNYYITGDLVRKDQEGYYWYVSREDDVLNVSGHLISPITIESAMNEISGVIDSMVMGKEDNQIGQIIVAYVVVDDGVDFKKLKRKIKSEIRNKLAFYMVPEVINVVDTIPKTHSGKIIRREIEIV